MAQVILPKHYKRNFWCLVGDFGFFGIGLAFIGSSTVIPSFLTALQTPAFVIGLMSTLQSACWLLPQLFAARYLADKEYMKPHILWPAGLGRTLLLVMAVLIWITGAQPAWLIIALMTLVVIGFWVGDGLASVPWFDFLSKVIPATRRGRLTSTGQTLSGIFGFLVGFAVEWMLSDRGLAFPNNYASLFFLAFVMLALSFLSLSFGIEEKGISSHKVPSWREYIPQLWEVLKHDRTYRRYIITRQIYGLSALASPFYMTYALDRLGLPAQVAGRYTSIGVMGSILAAMIFGWINERYGSKRVIVIGIAITTLIPIYALLAPSLFPDPAWLAWGYGLVFFFFNMSMSSMMPGWITYVLEHAPEAKRPTYVGLTNTINGINMLFSALGGVILQWSGSNYHLLFGITIAGVLLAWPVSLSLPEPRHKQTA
ncbi:MAG: MFS transporter [Anaerolineae bacterium]|nr:MFS transporter [Anaerolineae bacterium]